jgi:hypothetical protein
MSERPRATCARPKLKAAVLVRPFGSSIPTPVTTAPNPATIQLVVVPFIELKHLPSIIFSRPVKDYFTGFSLS